MKICLIAISNQNSLSPPLTNYSTRSSVLSSQKSSMPSIFDSRAGPAFRPPSSPSLTLRMIGRLTGEPIMETSVTSASLTPSISAIDQGGDDIVDLAHMADGILPGQGVRVPRPIPLHNFNCWRNGNHKNSSV